MKNLLLLLFTFSTFSVFAQFGNEVKKASSVRVTEDYFGYSVASERQYSIVGAPQSDLHGLNTTPSAGNGYAELFELTFSGIQFVQRIQPTTTSPSERFGFDVSMSGNYAAVSAPFHRLDQNDQNPLLYAGAVFIYENVNGTWQFSEKIVPNDRNLVTEFGYSIDMYGDYLVVGAPGDQAGQPGQPLLNYAGAVYVYERNANGSYQLIEKLVANQREGSSFLGYSVSIDQTAIAVGAPFHGLDMLNQNFINVSGAVYIYDFDGSQWNQTQKITAFDRYQGLAFGLDVAVNHNPRILAVGTKRDENGLPLSVVEFDAGAVYVYSDNGFGFANDAKLISHDREYREGFGCSIDLDDNYLAVGGRLDQDNMSGVFEVDTAGAVYIYNANSPSWTFSQKIISSDREAGDHFGQDVALSSFDTLGASSYELLVGAWKEDQDIQGSNFMERSGSVYFYGYTTIGLNEQEVNTLKAYPNPFSQSIHLGSTEENAELIVLNQTGQIVVQRRNPTESINLQELPAGCYTLQLIESTGVKSQMIVKQ